jgi:Cu(I)/Ag(I) efflux system membrane fusion protein
LGKVDYIYPTLEPSTRTLKVRLKFDNDDFSLMPNMFAQVEIDLGNIQPSLVVAKEAVIQTGEMNRVVMVLGQGKFKSVEVQIGRRDDKYIEILNGLQQGESVVTSAQFLIDSESSKSSDFKRMSHGMEMTSSITKSVMVEATLNQVLADTRQINVTHQSIPEWNRPQMTMTFKVSEQVDLATFTTGQIVTLSISDDDGKLIVQAIEDGMAMTMDSDPVVHKQHQTTTQQETR